MRVAVMMVGPYLNLRQVNKTRQSTSQRNAILHNVAYSQYFSRVPKRHDHSEQPTPKKSKHKPTSRSFLKHAADTSGCPQNLPCLLAGNEGAAKKRQTTLSKFRRQGAILNSVCARAARALRFLAKDAAGKHKTTYYLEPASVESKYKHR